MSTMFAGPAHTETYHYGEETLLGVEHGTDGLRVYDLLCMAGYGMRGASIMVDWHEETFTIRQVPHQGPERIVTGTWPLGDEIVRWVEAEQARTSSFEVYGLTSTEVSEMLSLTRRCRQTKPTSNADLRVPAEVLLSVRKAVLDALACEADSLSKSINRATDFDSPRPEAIGGALEHWTKVESLVNVLDCLGWTVDEVPRSDGYVEARYLESLAKVLQEALDLSRELIEAEDAGYRVLAGDDTRRAEALAERHALAAWIPEALKQPTYGTGTAAR